MLVAFVAPGKLITLAHTSRSIFKKTIIFMLRLKPAAKPNGSGPACAWDEQPLVLNRSSCSQTDISPDVSISCNRNEVRGAVYAAMAAARSRACRCFGLAAVARG